MGLSAVRDGAVVVSDEDGVRGTGKDIGRKGEKDREREKGEGSDTEKEGQAKRFFRRQRGMQK